MHHSSLNNIYWARRGANRYDRSDNNLHLYLTQENFTGYRPKEKRLVNNILYTQANMINSVQCRRKFLDQVLSSFRVRTHSFWLWNQKKLLTRHSVWSQIQSLFFFCFALHHKELTPANFISLGPLPTNSSWVPSMGGHRERPDDWRKGGTRVFLLTLWASVFSPIQWKNQ